MNAEYWRGRGLQVRGWLQQGMGSITGDAVKRATGGRDYAVGALMASLAAQREEAERVFMQFHNHLQRRRNAAT